MAWRIYHVPFPGTSLSSSSVIHANSHIIWNHDICVGVFYIVTRDYRKADIRPEVSNVFLYLMFYGFSREKIFHFPNLFLRQIFSLLNFQNLLKTRPRRSNGKLDWGSDHCVRCFSCLPCHKLQIQTIAKARR